MDELIKKGDKVIAKKNLMAFGVAFAHEGDNFEVADVFGNSVFLVGCNGSLTVDKNTFNEHFEKKAEKKIDIQNIKHEDKYVEDKQVDDNVKHDVIEKYKTNKITSDMIQDILDNSEFIVDTLFDKCTLVSCKLPNGFIITESSACVDPTNYDEDLGVEICMDKITSKVWELEGYRLQNEIYEAEYDDNDDEVCDECVDCPERYSCDHYNYPY